MPVPTDAGLEMLGRLPEPESLLLLGRHNHALLNFADLHNASIGIGPEGSGTAYLVRQLFEDPDLRGLGVRLSNHDLEDQAAGSPTAIVTPGLARRSLRRPSRSLPSAVCRWRRA